MIARPAPQQRRSSTGVWVLVALGLLVAANTSNPATPRAGHPAGGPPPTAGVPPPAGLTFTAAAGCQPAGDYASPRLDRRVRALLVAIATQHRVRVSCIRTGHSWYVHGTDRVSNHSVWRAVDVDRVRPSEVGSPWAFGRRPWYTDAGHQDHLHVGFAGPTQARGGR